ncbi:pyruvate kinase [Stigmatella aurantiaca DW4/3-1]|uniref:Pyruvate kinase n=1 Tax=Stigmatella aurantiaca (strain DW4/3-1) TaxID=378806 RepID=Q090R5_STIAD|nr:pyruvate kinase [Stigmatella aurantiaca DW4/3-1]
MRAPILRALMRRAKIVCTLGPASQSQDMLEALIEAGMDVARLNFSHGSHEQHAENIAKLRAASLKLRKAVGILGDLQGPKIRTGRFITGSTVLKEGAIFSITTDESVKGNDDIVSTTYAHLAADVNPGDRILLDDGLLELKVLETDKKQLLRTQVVIGGTLKNNKGINLPGVAVRADALTPKDREDLVFGIKEGVDFLALSFVRQPADIELARQAMAEAGRQVPIVAKLEKPEAIARLDAILDKTDGVMVARGDLGVEIPPRGGAGRPEGHHPALQPARPAGHRGHADAQLDDREPPPHARGGQRRGQRRVRRGGRGHALGRDGQRPLPHRVGADDGPHRPGGRVGGSGAVVAGPDPGWAHRRALALPGRDCPGGVPGGAGERRFAHRGVHAVGRDGAAAGALPAGGPHRGVQPEPGSAPPPGAALGRGAAGAGAHPGDRGDGEARGGGTAGARTGAQGRAHRHRLWRARGTAREDQQPAPAHHPGLRRGGPRAPGRAREATSRGSSPCGRSPPR